MINWSMIGAIGGMSSIIGGMFLFATRAIVRDEISKLNGTYLRKELADQKFEALGQRIDRVAEMRSGRGSGSHRAASAGAD